MGAVKLLKSNIKIVNFVLDYILFRFLVQCEILYPQFLVPGESAFL